MTCPIHQVPDSRCALCGFEENNNASVARATLDLFSERNAELQASLHAAEAACAEMRAALNTIARLEDDAGNRLFEGGCMQIAAKACANTTIGTGWHSQEEWESVQSSLSISKLTNKLLNDMFKQANHKVEAGLRFSTGIKEVLPSITLLEQQLSKACKDSERLDWLENSAYIAYRDRDPENKTLCDHHTLVDEDDGRKNGRRGIVEKTIREAIDAAMARTRKDMNNSHQEASLHKDGKIEGGVL